MQLRASRSVPTTTPLANARSRKLCPDMASTTCNPAVVAFLFGESANVIDALKVGLNETACQLNSRGGHEACGMHSAVPCILFHDAALHQIGCKHCWDAMWTLHFFVHVALPVHVVFPALLHSTAELQDGTVCPADKQSQWVLPSLALLMGSTAAAFR